MRSTLWIAVVLGAAINSSTGCQQRGPQQKTAEEKAPQPRTQEEIAQSIAQMTEGEADTMKTAPMGKIVLEFFPGDAPNHVENFKKLARSGFYDGVTFHRVIPGFMIQGGDPNTKDNDRSNDGMGGPGYSINAEFSSRKHLRGTLSMARTADPNSAGSQFFICVDPAPHLDGKYTTFGRVVAGMDVVDTIVSVPRGERDNPIKKVIMQSVTIVPRGEIADLPPPSPDADEQEVAVIEVVQEQ